MSKVVKRKKNEDGEELETKWEVFMRNYKTVPGFKELVKLVGYFLFFGIFIIIILSGQSSIKTNDNKNTTTTTQVVDTKTYKELLEDLYKTNKQIHANITINETKYSIEATNTAGVLSGLLESTSSTKRFKIENNVIYELNLEQATENANLFENISINYIIPANLVNILQSNKATKRVDGDNLIYNYNLDNNGISYTGEVIVTNNIIKNINLTNEYSSYNITFE